MTKKFSLSSIAFRQLYALITVILFGYFFFIECLNSKIELWYLPIAFIIIWQTLFIVFYFLTPTKFIKFFSILLLIINAIVFYFMYAYGIAVDKIMFLNVIQTDSAETGDLLNIKILYTVILLGIIPSILIFLSHISPSSKKNTWRTMLTSLTGVILLGAAAYPQTNLFLHRFKYLLPYLPPLNYITGALDTLSETIKTRPSLVRISEDVVRQPISHKPNLIVFVVGESARAANFSLNGYHRPTNSALEAYLDELVYYPDVKSCGTATAISIPCIFSSLSKKDYQRSYELYTENLIDIFKQAGYKILWKDNDGGCKHVCDRVHYEQPCKNKSCLDEILLNNLKKQISQTSNNQFIILHTRGSHGPAYSKQYDTANDIYSPICQTNDLWNCTEEEITNVYDNTIHYTSTLLAQIIDILKSLQNKYNTALFYTSDHGESLGENGIYLHSATYDTAPEAQTKVPMFIWFPKNNNYGLSHSCLKKGTDSPYSHDNVFHSLLGLAGIPTQIYQSELDIFATCHKK